VRIGRLGVDLESVRPGEVWGVKAPTAPGTDFTGMLTPWASPCDVEGEGAELGAGGRGG
jgi:hypothetical protein